MGHDMQERQPLEDQGLQRVVEKLDSIIERLKQSCVENPQIDLCMPSEGSEFKPFDSRDIEDRLDKIVKKMSQSGYFSRLIKEDALTPTKAHILNIQSLSTSPATPSSEKIMVPLPNSQCKNVSENVVMPTATSFRYPLLTPRSLMSKFGSSEKMDACDSPPKSRRLSSSGSRSRRLSSAFSFLSSPIKVGAALSFRSSSSKPTD
ncbi:hypothetical protein KP509_04G052800 [Ceratopteris richardii]|nr:hypothetical protein KP509_04G052800 [Ceratopteris richardii]